MRYEGKRARSEDSNVEPTRLAPSDAASSVEAVVDVSIDSARFAEHRLPCLGELDTPVRPADELHAQRIFECLDLSRPRRLLITFDRYLPEAPDLIVEIVVRERQLIALQKDNPLAKRAVVPLKALANELFVVGRGARHAHSIAALCQANGFDPRIGQEAGDMVTGLALVANGYGVQIVPESIRTVSMPGLVYRSIRAQGDSSIDLQCAYRRDETSLLLAALLAVIREFSRSWTSSARDAEHSE